MATVVSRRTLLAGGCSSFLIGGSITFAQTGRMLRWSTQDQIDFASFFRRFGAEYSTPVDCADLAIDALITFAGQKRLPVRLFDFDGPGHSKRWLTYDPRRDDWQIARARLMEQLGAINVIENSREIGLAEVRAGDLVMHENVGGGGYTGHTRVLISATYDRGRDDYLVRRYEGSLPPIVPDLEEGWFSEIDNVYGGKPRRWNFGQFAMA